MQIDTGGFFIYQPPDATLTAKPPIDGSVSGATDWSGSEWSNPAWEPVGFAYSITTSNGYSAVHWFSKLNQNGLKKYVRPGTDITNQLVDGPLLFRIQLDDGGNELPPRAFADLVEDTFGVALPAGGSDANFEYWVVDEELEP